MKKVSILALDDSAATTITGPYDVFNLTGVLWNIGQGEDITPSFKPEIITPKGDPVKCMNNLTILPDRAMTEVENTDLIVISAVLDIVQTLAKQGEIIDWLREQYKKGTPLAAICTGSFVLAETGLLDGKIATTHWRTVDEFRELYPKVNLKPERLVTDAGDLFCSGGFNSSIDLSSYLVEKFCGRAVAIQCAKSLVHDTGRCLQTPYTVFDFQHDHKDEPILNVQKILEKNYKKNIDFETLAGKCGLGRRTLERRFKTATGDTPNIYLQRIRVEEAKRLLETGNITFNEISYNVGYEDTSSFRKLFTKHTGLKPNEYKTKFIRNIDFGSQ
jgi:transcriptional regulator GlxA family with amidase domain